MTHDAVTYDPAKDGHDSYYAAIEAKRLRGDVDGWRAPAGPLAKLGMAWDAMASADIDAQVTALRQKAREMADKLDEEARSAVEGSAEWRDLNPRENRYAG